MKKLIFLAIIAAAAWYGWKNWPAITQRIPGHEAVIVNHSGGDMARVRLTVDGQTFVKETLADGAEVRFEFKVSDDASFRLDWQLPQGRGEQTWSGGMVPKGPLTQRHRITVDGDGGVLIHSEPRIVS